MRIAYITAVFPPTRGGMCTVAAAEAHELAEAHEVVVYTLATGDTVGERRIDRGSAFDVQRLVAFPRVRLSGFVPQLLWKLRHERIVYAHLPAYGFFEVLWLWKKIYKGKLVVTVHMDPVGEGVFAWFFKLQRFMYRAVLRSADEIRVSTQRLAESDLIRLLGPAHARKVRVIPFGVDLARFAPSGAPSNHPVFLFVGKLARTAYFKGVELLLRSFKSLNNPDAELWFVGDGDERARYEQLARDLKLGNRVTFLGAVPDVELPQIYSRATAVVLPSTDTSETFGLVLLEAMACGTPVIASRLPGVDALVRDGETGMLVEPGSGESLSNALQSAVDNFETWKNYRKLSRNHAENYGSWESIVRRIESLLY